MFSKFTKCRTRIFISYLGGGIVGEKAGIIYLGRLLIWDMESSGISSDHWGGLWEGHGEVSGRSLERLWEVSENYKNFVLWNWFRGQDVWIASGVDMLHSFNRFSVSWKFAVCFFNVGLDVLSPDIRKVFWGSGANLQMLRPESNTRKFQITIKLGLSHVWCPDQSIRPRKCPNQSVRVFCNLMEPRQTPNSLKKNLKTS